MDDAKRVTGLRAGTILLTALSLSIGWGIRGNFGHEYGAMIPGALAALAVCLLSGRKDWRDRAPYFAFFGALGWTFGGSMSYMQVVAYTHSGHLPSQIYGFFGLFVLGFLWSTMGGAGTAFAAVADKQRLVAVFRPLCWIFVAWIIYQKFFKLYLETLYPANFDATWSRQAAHTYWFDSDWMEAATALLALLCFELWDNRKTHLTRFRPLWFLLVVLAGASAGTLTGLNWEAALADAASATGSLAPFFVPLCAIAGALGLYLLILLRRLPPFVVVGAFIGYGAQLIADRLGWTSHIAQALLHYQVSPEFVARAAAERGISEAAVLADQLINWPNLVLFYPQYIGCFVGGLAGLSAYFLRFGRFASGASLFLYMVVGWFTCFLLFPVLLGHPVYEWPMIFRMTPPRGDNWAGVLGVAIGTGLWMLRNRCVSVLFAMLLTGVLGGMGFAGGALIKLMLVRPGNVQVVSDPAVVDRWAHWQIANWHSVMEQTDGFLFGVGLAIALGLLARRAGRNDGPAAPGSWTTVFATGFVLFGVVYLNMYKNVVEWVKQGLMPENMPAPLFESVSLSAWGWFNLLFGIAAVAGIGLMIAHQRRFFPLVPPTALGRGQMLFVALLAAVVAMNFERAISGFTDQRLITEGVILVNGVVAVLFVLLLPKPDVTVPSCGLVDYGPFLVRSVCLGLLTLLITTFGMAGIIRAVYGGSYIGHAGKHHRFGSEAEWRIKPTEKSSKHS